LEPAGEELIYTVEGSGFLRHMVRNIVGTLLLVGRGRLAAAQIAQILAAKDRSAAGRTVSARGLHLVRVEYPTLPST
jgi:tRNA pseudouridine38-40 synthase